MISLLLFENIESRKDVCGYFGDYGSLRIRDILDSSTNKE